MTTEEIQASVQKHALQKRAEKLAWILGQIKKKMVEIGTHIKEIRDEKLYEPKYATFEDFCRAELGFGNKRANQIIAGEDLRLQLAGEVSEDPQLSPIVPKLHESQLRELVTTPHAQRVEVLKEASKEGRPTAIKIKQAKARIAEGEIIPPVNGTTEVSGTDHRCPTCNQVIQK